MVDRQHAIFGDDLALLSLKVAVQIDRKLHGAEVDQSAFDAFGTRLSNAGIADAQPATISYLQSNPAATEVLANALKGTSAQMPSNTTELARALAEIIQKLKLLNDSSDSDLSRMKLFCLSLHRSMMSQKLPPPLEPDHAFEERLGIIR